MSFLTDREFHAFLSYSRKDSAIAKKLYEWLTNHAGFKIWLDVKDIGVGSAVVSSLSGEMSKCRNWIVLASKNSLASAWVKFEREQALNFSVNNRSFNLIVLRIDDCPIETDWQSTAMFSWLNMTDGILTTEIGRQIIDRLDGRTLSGRLTGLHNVYVSRGWRDKDLKFADVVCEGLCARKWALKLIGDSEDRNAFSEARINDIMATCSGHIVILPPRTSSGEATEHDYRYFIRELAISNKLGIPVLLLAEETTSLPPSLASGVICLNDENYHGKWLSEPPEWLEKFIEELMPPKLSHHLFLAAEYKDNLDRVARLRDFMEAVTGIPCQIGRDFEGTGLRGQIISSVSTSHVVIANLASVFESDPSVSILNSNTCVEAGIALGAHAARGNKPLPVFLVAQYAPGETKRTSKLPFMFEDEQVTYYVDEVELLANCRRLLFPYRRRIMNYEFTKRV